MKTKLSILVFSVFLIFAFIFNPASNFRALKTVQPQPPLNNNITDNFIIGAIATDADAGFTNLNSLHLNLWHKYTKEGYSGLLGRHVPEGWTNYSGCSADTLNGNLNDYSAGVTGVIRSINSNNSMRSFLQRPKIEWLCYGKRSDYECETPSKVNEDLFFYTFQQHGPAEDIQDFSEYNNNAGNWVRHCRFGTDSPGFVVKRLKCNTEQSIQAGSGNEWQASSESNWIVKPRIRIDSAFADSNPNDTVCEIRVVSGDSTILLKDVFIKAGNFRDVNLNYDGRYLEEYNLSPGINLNIHGKWGYLYGLYSRGDWQYDSLNSRQFRSKVDIQVKWFGKCDMWIDRVRVDDDVADGLMNPNSSNFTLYNSWLHDEAQTIACSYNSPLKYYVELTWFNNIPCIAYVSRALDSFSQIQCGRSIGMVTDITEGYGSHGEWSQRSRIFNAGHIKRNYIDKVNAKEVLFECYPLTSLYNNSSNSNYYSKIPNTLPYHTSGGEVWAKPVNPDIYDTWLQENLDNSPYAWESGSTDSHTPSSLPTCQFSDSTPDQMSGFFRFVMKAGNQISRDANIPFIYMQQVHHWFTVHEVRREPTNEELTLLTNLAVSYGAKGIMYYWYPNHNNGVCDYSYGITDAGNNPRHENVYHQYSGGQGSKFNTITANNEKLLKWDTTLMSFDNRQTRSFIYRIERNELISQSYFRDIYTYKPGTANINCQEDFPEEIFPPAGTVGECKQYRYLQVATFENPSERNSNYFMVVNRRCSPFINDSTTDANNGGRRLIIAQFNQYNSQLNGANNWRIINVADNSVVQDFDKMHYHAVNFGWFQPGEGRLYKMVPVPQSGGTLAGDENISGESFTCEAPVYNNGHNITIGANTTIHFNDSSRFVMNGGVFTVGDRNTSGSQNITSDAVTGSSWHGHSFTNCEVNIYGATFNGLANDTTYAVNIIDCPVVDIRGCTFNTNNSLKGGINAVYFTNLNAYITNIYIGGNTFNSSGSTLPTVNISSYAGVTTPLIIENNTFSEGNTAIFLSGVTGGAIKGNTITDNYIGINALTSSIDISENIISSTVRSGMGIFASGGSELKMNSSGSFTLGGHNSISNEATGTNNINVDGSTFLLNGGENVFNIIEAQTSYHLHGYFPQLVSGPFDETDNCFKVNNSPVNPTEYVTSGYQGSQITFNFTPYLTGCEYNQCQDYVVVYLGGGVYDTICTGNSGSGGSQSGSNKQIPLSRGVTAKGSRGVFVISAAKQQYDSVCVLMRYRNYLQAKTKCLDLINSYPDSIQSLNAVSKLFLATVASDTTYNAVNNLKIYYEELILNHQSNVSLVKRANYFILKCKVRMREYSQALAGFQQIINLNPYSYEGLIARWDYMATSLLVNGSGGGEQGISDFGLLNADLESEDLDGNPQSENRNPKSSYDDKNPFTKEQRQDIRKSINTAIEISKNDDETKMKTLEVKSDLGDVNASKELTQMRSLKQVVKTEKPKSITEHIKIVSEDIRKVFGANTSGKGNEPKNLPTVFRISQNYPNPFNPATKINYDLPRDSKVNIVIYDILGREVKRLVNNEIKQAGSYIIDFNASNYASGVYFYRIEAEEPNGNKFVDSKKMVLLK